LDDLKGFADCTDQLQKDVLEVGSDIINAYYSDDSGHSIGMDEVTEQLWNLFKNLNEIMLPILKTPNTTDVRTLLQNLDDHEERVEKFSDSYKSAKAFTFMQFGDKSFYLHWLLEHAHHQARYALSRWGLHITRFSCQTTEHFHRILKRLIERLHGFTNRSMSPNKPWMNKFGYVINEFVTRLLHFFETINTAKRVYHCSECGEPGHNRRKHIAK
jgi:hypothetical protein